MGCNCGKKSRLPVGSVTSYVLASPDGTTEVYRTRLEAEAQNIRKGGGGKVQPAR